MNKQVQVPAASITPNSGKTIVPGPAPPSGVNTPAGNIVSGSSGGGGGGNVTQANVSGAEVSPATSSTTVGVIENVVHLDSAGGTFSCSRLPSDYPVPASASQTGKTASTAALPQTVSDPDSLSQFKVDSGQSPPDSNASNQSLDTGNSLSGSPNTTSSDINFNNFK